MDRKLMRLYAITDRTWLNGRTLEETVECALRGGATIVQLREKHLGDEAFLAQARALRLICTKYAVPLIINDRPDIAAACDADGVHIGQSDMDIRQARRILGVGKYIGTSAHSVEEALCAQENGADYLGAGSVFCTSTKLDAGHLPRHTLEEICRAVSIPVVAIGGITEENLPQLAGSGVDGVAVVSAVFAQTDIAAATRRLRALADEL